MVAALFAGCSYHPARFAAVPPVTEIADDAPIPLSIAPEADYSIRYAEIYVKQPILDALDPHRYPTAGDINALDDVPPSSFFRGFPPPPSAPLPEPSLPFTVLPKEPRSWSGALVVRDGNNITWELVIDPAHRREFRTAAALVAPRLLAEVGYRVAGTKLVVLEPASLVATEPAAIALRKEFLARGPTPVAGKQRLVATRWPVGIDAGPTEISSVRADDPNDRVPHRDRRTFRALGAFGSWLRTDELGSRELRDAYIGAPGEGHLQHWVVGLSSALGVGRALRIDDNNSEDDDAGPEWTRSLMTLGLGKYEADSKASLTFRSLGDIDEEVDPLTYHGRRPFEPIRRQLPGDGYWAAKILASLPKSTTERAIDESAYSDAATRDRLVRVLEARKAKVVATWFDRVSPLELTGGGSVVDGALVLRDEAARLGLAPNDGRTVTGVLLDGEGHTLDRGSFTTVDGTVRLPLSGAGYRVWRVTLSTAPRPVTVHLIDRDGTYRAIAIRH